MRACSRGADRTDQGFTLVELMVVVAVVGILMAMASLYVAPDKYAATARGYADALGAFAESTRDRAIGTHAWQRIVLDPDEGVRSYQAPITGFVKPADDEWVFVGGLAAPSASVEIAAVDPIAHPIENTSLPGDGAGLPATLDFAPDGTTATAMTIFVADQARNYKARVVVFRATGSVMVLDQW
jgi:prepilin-type N-terminal cleavage/methylation domain-containing protein